MAELYLALATGIEGFEKLVVLKRMLPHLARQDELRAMFLDEARLAATLHHPNIAQVFDIGEEDGAYFFAMEFLHGVDLMRLMTAALARGEPVPLARTVTIMAGVCAGLHYAHEQVGPDGAALGIVHRDVSPHNIFVTYDGAVKLCDFGIAKAARRLAVTRTGMLKGKVGYMSPEQCAGQPLDRRADVYAAAVVLWELTAGRQLWSGETEFQIMKAVVEQDPPAPRAVRADCPPELERIVLRGLRRDPAERYQTAQELQLDLEAFARTVGLEVSAVPLAALVRDLFRPEIEAWQDAQRRGLHLAAHLVERYGGTPVDAAPGVATVPLRGGEPATDPEGVPAAAVGDADRPASDLLLAAVPAPPPPRSLRWWPIALVAALLAGAVSAWVASRPRPGPAAGPPAVTAPGPAPLGATGPARASAAAAPDAGATQPAASSPPPRRGPGARRATTPARPAPPTPARVREALEAPLP
jgi:post-segregation antitoxin (ccd killing protein)